MMIPKYDFYSSSTGSHSNGRHSSRMLYLSAVILTILLGLASRRYEAVLPGWIAAHAGDALWAAMIYWGLRLLTWPRRPFLAAIGALLFSYFIECSQLYQAEWINRIRDTTLGALILGHGFLFADLWRYTAGVCIALVLDSAGRWICRYVKNIHK
ncbi:ribosomal maturation YjgA family protein [Paenibacillus sp. Z6-24]